MILPLYMTDEVSNFITALGLKYDVLGFYDNEGCLIVSQDEYDYEISDVHFLEYSYKTGKNIYDRLTFEKFIGLFYYLKPISIENYRLFLTKEGSLIGAADKNKGFFIHPIFKDAITLILNEEKEKAKILIEDIINCNWF